MDKYFGTLVSLCGLLLLSGAVPLSEQVSGPPEYQAWRRQREEALRAPGGYLSLVGLHWLRPGELSFGSASDNDIVLPAGRAPQRAGVLRVGDAGITAVAADGVALTVDGERVSTVSLRSDASDPPTKVQVGELTMWVIERSGRLALRVSDPQGPILQRYAGTRCFEYSERFRVPARFHAFAAPRGLDVPSIIGTKLRMESGGLLTFELGGRSHTLQPTDGSDGDLFVIFADRTNGTETYGGGRFVRVAVPGPDGATVIDFNRAYNPACAYNPNTTCPLPPPQNKLPLRIEAGERIDGIGREPGGSGDH